MLFQYKLTSIDLTIFMPPCSKATRISFIFLTFSIHSGDVSLGRHCHTVASMPNSTSNPSQSQSSERTKTPTSILSGPIDSSVYVDSKGTRYRVLAKQSGAIIHQINDCQVLKSGDRVKRSEAVAMKLVLEETDISLPEWLAEDFPHDREVGCLWMTFIPGTTLDVSWEKLEDDTKQRLCRDIWDIIAKIREIRRPLECQRFFQCAADGSTTHDPLIKDLNEPPAPLLNDSALRERIYERYLYYAGRRYEGELPHMLPLSQHSVSPMLI